MICDWSMALTFSNSCDQDAEHTLNMQSSLRVRLKLCFVFDTIEIAVLLFYG